MTREEAIDILVGVIATNSEEENEALDVAIEALQADPVKHGKWENHGNEWLTCSLCDWECAFHYDYCPQCGAKMNKE